jgi:hypothetical protein
METIDIFAYSGIAGFVQSVQEQLNYAMAMDPITADFLGVALRCRLNTYSLSIVFPA